MSTTHHSKLIRAAALTSVLALGGLAACNKTDSAASLIAEARQFQAKGDNAAALIQLKNAAVKDPANAEARMLLGEAYNLIGDPLSAEKEIRKAMELGAPVERTLPELLLAQLFLEQFQQVIDGTTATAYTASAKVTGYRAVAFFQLGKHAEATEAFERALKVEPGYPIALVGLANISLAKGDKDSAAKYIDQAIAQNPKNVDTWMVKGAFERSQGKTAAALAAYDTVLTLQPGSPGANLQKGYIHIAEGKYEEAATALAAAKKSAPKDLMITYARALLDFTQGKYTESLDSLLAVLRVAPDHMPSVLLAGAVQFKLKSYPQAEQHLKKYHEAHPDSDYARKLLASTRVASGDNKGAIALLAPVLAKSEDPQLLGIAGKAYMDNQEFDKSTELFERASKLDPKTALLRTSLGLSKLELGEQARGLTELELATKLDLTSTDAGMTLAMTALRLKQYDKALAAARDMEKRQPNDPAVRNLTGLALLGKLDRAGARASFDKALALNATYFPALDNLARMDMNEKKLDAARKRYQDFLQAHPTSVEAMTALGALTLVQGNAAEATGLFEKANAVDPAAVGPALFLATHYVHQGQKPKALTLVRKLLVANPEHPAVLEQLGQLQLDGGEHGAAMETFTKLSVVQPKSPEAHLRLGSAHAAMGSLPSATVSLKRALSLRPDFLEAQIALATVHLRQRQMNEALALAKQMQQQRPGLPVGYVSEGDLLVIQGKAAAAVPLYEKAYGLGKNAELLIKLYGALHMSGRGKDADARVLAWRRDHPDDLKVPSFLVGEYLGNKNFQLAITELEAILKKVPGHAPALNNLAFAYERVKDPRALATAERALKAAPTAPDILDTLGVMLVERGDLTRGVALLRDASSRMPEAADIRYHLIKALIKSNDKAGARKEFEYMLANQKNYPLIEEVRTLVK